jgi:chromosome segregation ATPase
MVKVNELSQDFILVQDTLQNVIDFNDNFSSSLLNINARIREYSPDIRENLMQAKSIFLNISNISGSLSESITKNKPIAISDIDDMLGDLDQFEKRIHEVEDKIPELKEQIDGVLSDLSDLRHTLDDIRKCTSDTSTLRGLLTEVSYDCKKVITDLDNLEKSVNNFFDPIITVLDQLEELSTGIENTITDLQNTSSFETVKNRITIF